MHLGVRLSEYLSKYKYTKKNQVFFAQEGHKYWLLSPSLLELHNAASDQGLHCLPLFHQKFETHQRVVGL